ncbi:PilZ domain-containing protein [Methylobacterium sp. E-016]|nr:PilZ domain-containing protein [Methylobacterium sp. E-016]
MLLASGDEVSCTAVLSSPLQGEIFVEAKATLGEVVVCVLDGVGILVGKVAEVRPAGFVVDFMVKRSHRERVAARLEWHIVQADRSAQLRRAPRLVPFHRSVEVRLAETVVLAGTILNISMSGAKITLQPNPGLFVGALVRIGSRLATVVRAIEGGVAVQFVEPFPADNFDERIRL